MLFRSVMPAPPVSGPSGLPDCSHDSTSEGAITHNPNGSTEEVIAGDSDWDMGDDEMELLDVESQVKIEDTQTVDIDLTLDDDIPSTAEEQPVETCPICEKELAGFNAAVRLPCPHLLGQGCLILAQEIHAHVDRCLNAAPDTPQIGRAHV